MVSVPDQDMAGEERNEGTIQPQEQTLNDQMNTMQQMFSNIQIGNTDSTQCTTNQAQTIPSNHSGPSNEGMEFHN